MINPYENINWRTIEPIMAISHAHCENDEHLQKLANGGIRFAPLSNYHPSAPWYPLSEHFSQVPEGMFGAPNAEHWNFTNYASTLHLNGLGSNFSSGDATHGMMDTWQNGITQILVNLKYADAGGVTINHPTYTHLSLEDALGMLDFDDRVLGIEIYNASTKNEQDQYVGEYNLELWDRILLTGRRCWGFCASDHMGKLNPDMFTGVNKLLPTSGNEYGCLKAYRDGAFYGNIRRTGLEFTEITLNDSNFFVSASEGATLKIICDGKEYPYGTNTTNFSIPFNAVYVRAEAHNGTDSIFSNPIIFREHKNTNKPRPKFNMFWV